MTTARINGLKNTVQTINQEAWDAQTRAIDEEARNLIHPSTEEGDYNVVKEQLYAICLVGYKPNHEIRVVAELYGGDHFDEFFELTLEEQLSMFIAHINGDDTEVWLKNHRENRIEKLAYELLQDGANPEVVGDMDDEDLQEAHASRFGYIR